MTEKLFESLTLEEKKQCYKQNLKQRLVNTPAKVLETSADGCGIFVKETDGELYDWAVNG